MLTNSVCSGITDLFYVLAPLFASCVILSKPLCLSVSQFPLQLNRENDTVYSTVDM